MSYDSSGNMTYQRDNFKDLTKTITVDSQNRITQVQDALSTTIGNYWYDEGGFRVRKKALVPSGASFKNQEILYPSKFYGLEYSEETNILSSINNVYLNGVRIAALNEDGVTAYFLTDQVDSVAHVLDEGAHTLSRMQYEPYGETLVQRGTLDFAPKYNSQELDRETNFYFYNARYYDPQIARFTSADSVIPERGAVTQNWNRFMYVAGNPIVYKDPTGHSPGISGVEIEEKQRLRDAGQKDAVKEIITDIANGIRSEISQFSNDFMNPKGLPFPDAQSRFGYALDKSYERNIVDPIVGLASNPGAVVDGAKQAYNQYKNDITSGNPYASGKAITKLQIGTIATLASATVTSRSLVRKVSSTVQKENRLWTYGTHKSAKKWQNKMNKRGWTESQIDEAMKSRKKYDAPNNVNKGNGATRYVHPKTGRSVVIDNKTRQLLHVGGDNYSY